MQFAIICTSECSSVHQHPTSPPPLTSHCRLCGSSPVRKAKMVTLSATMKTHCTHPGCTNNSLNGGVCTRHGSEEKVKRCSHKGCSNKSRKGGVCRRHGSIEKRCSHEGCTTNAAKGGVCCKHGAKLKQCSHGGCTHFAVNGGVCMRHGAKVKRCSHEGCTKYAQKGGVCMRHGSKEKPSRQHHAKPLTAPSCKVGLPPTTKGCNATADGAAARREGGTGVHDSSQTNIISAAIHPSPSLCPSTMAPNFDDEDEIGAWIWRSSRIARLLSANNSGEVL